MNSNYRCTLQCMSRGMILAIHIHSLFSFRWLRQKEKRTLHNNLRCRKLYCNIGELVSFQYNFFGDCFFFFSSYVLKADDRYADGWWNFNSRNYLDHLSDINWSIVGIVGFFVLLLLVLRVSHVEIVFALIFIIVTSFFLRLFFDVVTCTW